MYANFMVTMKIIARVSNKSMISIAGGTKIVVAVSIVLVATIVLNLVGSIGTSIYYGNDADQALVYWDITSLAVALFSILSGVQTSVMFIKFARIIENALEATNRMLDNSKSKLELQELSKRFRASSKMLLMCLPAGAGLWVLHAFVLPMC